MPKSPRWLGWMVALSTLAVAGSARGAEVDVAGKPLQIDVTNTSIGNYHFNNDNDVKRVASTKLDDDYAEWLNRFNLQLNWWRLTLGVRVDSYVAQRPTDARIGDLVAEDIAPTDGRGTVQLTRNYIQQLNTRFLTTVYPTKLYVNYTQPSVEVTLGDFYVQLGRGLVFSVRKIDELSIDTTVRGAKAAFDKSFGGFHLGALAFGGEMNPLRIDETSGRRINVFGGDPLFFGFPKANEYQYQDFGTTGNALTIDQTARPNYLEDRAFGGKIEAGTKLFTLAGNAAVIARRNFDDAYSKCIKGYPDRDDTKVVGTTLFEGLCQVDSPTIETGTDPSRAHNQIRNFSGSLSVPSIADHGDLYVEIAGQQLADPTAKETTTHGFAAYVAASVRAGPVSVSLEGKHYRSFFPLPANIDTISQGSGGPEFNNIFYSSPPTAQSIYIEPVAGSAPNLCVTGGRALATYRFTPRASLYTWLGRFASWTELQADNFNCNKNGEEVNPVTGKTTLTGPSTETDTWDYAAGAELFLEKGRSKINVYMGALDISSQAKLDVASAHAHTFYREGYVRYDLVKHIAGPVALQVQGWHRRRYEPTTNRNAWWEGENYTAIQWSPHLSGIFGFEYEIKDGCQPGLPLGNAANPQLAGKYGKPLDTCTFFNGGAQWRAAGSGGVVGKVFDTVNVFVGDRRGALRCVSGVCRVFPPFSGGKIELVSRF